MAEELFIPKLGQTVEEVTLMDWLVADGTKVDFGVPILEVETDKAVFPIEANASGYLHLGPFKAGDVVPVLTVVATIGKKDERFAVAGAAPAAEAQAAEAGLQPVAAAAAQPATQPGVEPAAEPAAAQPTAPERAFASPRARKLAREKHVDLTRVTPTGGEGARVIEKDVAAYLSQLPKVTPVAANMAVQAGLDMAGMVGTGPKGAITKADIARALNEKAPAPATAVPTAPASAANAPTASGPATAVPAANGLTAAGPILPPAAPAGAEVTKTIPLSGVRGIIFERMAASVHTTARVTLVSEVDATRLVKAREQLKEEVSAAWGFAPGYNDLLGLIVARTLRDHPSMNARVSADGRAIEWLARVNLGLAVDTERGLLVPVVQDAAEKSLRQFGAEFRQMVDRARAGRSLPGDLSGGTFTITNLGMYAIDAFTPVINLPEAAILGVGRINEKVVPHKGKIRVRKMLTLSLVFDHRLNDGAPAARFLQQIKQVIENPYLLLGL